MTVGSFDPANFDLHAIIVTEGARAHLEDQVARSGHAAVRLGVRESGCNGYMYTLDYLDAPSAEDHRIPAGGTLALYVRTADLPLVAGTEIELVREGLNASLRFKNPNAESHCGCGESFAVKTASA